MSVFHVLILPSIKVKGFKRWIFNKKRSEIRKIKKDTRPRMCGFEKLIPISARYDPYRIGHT